MTRDSPAPCCRELDSDDEKKRGFEPTIFAKFRELLLLISAEAAYIAGTERQKKKKKEEEEALQICSCNKTKRSKRPKKANQNKIIGERERERESLLDF